MKNHLAYYNTYFALLKEYLPVYPVNRGTFIGPFCRVSNESLMRALIIFCRSFWRTLSISKSLMSLTLLELLDFIRWCGGGNLKLSVQQIIAKSKRSNFIYGFDTVQVNGSNRNEYKMTFASEESYSFSDTFIFCDFYPLRASMKNFSILMCIGFFMNTVLFWSYPSIMTMSMKRCFIIRN